MSCLGCLSDSMATLQILPFEAQPACKMLSLRGQIHGFCRIQQSKLKEKLSTSSLGPSLVYWQRPKPTKVRKKEQQRFKTVQCRSELAHDAPFAIAIGTCVLNSVVFPARDNRDDIEDGQSMEDVRYAAMGIISFIPFFNWLSWVFAWLDTGRQRYLVYAIVYLAPYVRTDLTLSPEDSWLPIASILTCILHIQLEISLKSGELQDFRLFGDVSKFLLDHKGGKRVQEQLGSLFQKSQVPKMDREEEKEELLSAEEETKMELEEWDKKLKSSSKDPLLTEEDERADLKDAIEARKGLGNRGDSDAS